MIRTEENKYYFNVDNGDKVLNTDVKTTVYYKREEPYKLFGIPASSSLKFKFDLHDLFYTKYVTVAINHCSTISNGRVDYFMNDDLFKADYASAPRDNFGVEKFDISLDLLKSGENCFMIILKMHEYLVSDVTISISTMYPFDVVDKRLTFQHSTSEDIKIYDFSTDVNDCRFTKIKTTDDNRPGKRYKLFDTPGESSCNITFSIPDDNTIQQVTLILNHCRMTDVVLVDVTLNDFPLCVDYCVVPRDKFDKDSFIVHKRFFKTGADNTLVITLVQESRGVYCLSDVTVQVTRVPELTQNSNDSLLRETCIGMVKELVLLCSTRRHSIERLRKIADEIDVLHKYINVAETGGALMKIAGGLFCSFCSLLKIFHVDTATPIPLVMNNVGSALTFGGTAVNVAAHIYESINNSMSIKEAQAIWDHDQILTNSIRNHMTKVQEYSLISPNVVTTYLCIGDANIPNQLLQQILESFFITINDTIKMPLDLCSGIATSLSGLVELKRKNSKFSNNNRTEATTELRSLAKKIEDNLLIIEEPLQKCYNNLLKEIGEALRSNNSESLEYNLTNISAFNGFKGLDLGHFSNKYDRYWVNAFRDNVKKLWKEMKSNMSERDLGKPIDIIVIAHGTVGSPLLQNTDEWPSVLKSHPQHLLFPTNNPMMSVIFYQPWGVSIDTTVVERIAKHKTNWAEYCYFYYQNANGTKTYIPPEDMPQMPGNWNVMTSENITHKLIPTVWMHCIDAATSPYRDLNMAAINKTASPNQIIYRYNLKDPLPLMFFTQCIKFVMDNIEEYKNIQLTVNVHWASSLELSPRHLNVDREMDQNISQYRKSFHCEKNRCIMSLKP